MTYATHEVGANHGNNHEKKCAPGSREGRDTIVVTIAHVCRRKHARRQRHTSITVYTHKGDREERQREARQ